MFTYNYTEIDFISSSIKVAQDTLQQEIWIDSGFDSLFLGVVGEINEGLEAEAEYRFLFENELSAEELALLDAIVEVHEGAPTPLTELEIEISTAGDFVDAAAGAARARYITVSEGQDAVYVNKGMEAQAYIDAAYPTDTANYPFITAEKNARGLSAREAADSIKSIAESWTYLASNIEEIRLGYKTQIKAQSTKRNVQALRNKAKAILDSI